MEVLQDERGKKFHIPQGLKPLLEEMSREVIRNQPENIYEFLADYLEGKLKKTPEGFSDNKSTWYTFDGKLVSVDENGILVGSDGKRLPQGTQLLSPSGEIVAVNSLGKPVPLSQDEKIDHDAAIGKDGKGPQYKTADGKIIRKTSGGTLVDEDGRPVPPGTKIIAPSGQPLTVNQAGKLMPLSPEENVDHYATIIQAAFRGHLARRNTKEGRNSITEGSKTEGVSEQGGKSDKKTEKALYKTEDGKVIRTTKSGTLVDEEGRTVPPGTRLNNSSGEILTVDSTGKPVTISKGENFDHHSAIALAGKPGQGPQYKTEDGKVIRKTSGGTLVDEDGRPVPPGTTIIAPSGEPLTVNQGGKLVPLSHDDIDHYATVIQAAYRGHMVRRNTKEGQSTTLPSGEGQDGRSGQAPAYKTEDGKVIKTTKSGTLIDEKGRPVPPGTKIYSSSGEVLTVNPDGKTDGQFDHDAAIVQVGKSGQGPQYKTEDGKAIRKTSGGTLVDEDGRPVPPGTTIIAPSGELLTVNHSGKLVPLSPDDVDHYATVIQAAYRGHMVRRNTKEKEGRGSISEQSKAQEQPHQALIYTSEDGKVIRITPSGTLVDQEGKPVPPGTKLTSFTGQKVIVSSAGTAVPQTSIHEHVDKVLSKALDLVDVLEHINDQEGGTIGLSQPQNEWLTNYWSSHNVAIPQPRPGGQVNPGDSTLNSMADALNFVLSDDATSMGPIESFIEMIQKAIEGLISKLSSFEQGGEGLAQGGVRSTTSRVAQSSTIVLKTEDGRVVRKTPSGHYIDQEGRPLAPGTALISSTGEVFKVSADGRLGPQSTGTSDGKSGSPLYKTENGKNIRVTTSGTLIDEDGWPVPLGTKLFTRSGELLIVSPTGKAVPFSGENSGSSMSKGGKFGQGPVYKTENGKIVQKTPSGTLVDEDGWPVAPGTKLFSSTGEHLIVDNNGKPVPLSGNTSQSSAMDKSGQDAVFKTENGKIIRKSPSGNLVDEDGWPVPPGTKLFTPSGELLIVSPNGKPVPYSAGNEKQSGSKAKSDQAPGINKIMFTEDGQEIEATPSGRVLTLGGSPAPGDTKIKTIDLKNIISGEGFPETNLFTESGIPVVVTSSGRVFTIEGKELFPGTILKTSDNRFVTVSASGGIVLRAATSAPSASNAMSPKNNKKPEGSQSGSALGSPNGKAVDNPPKAGPSSSDAESGNDVKGTKSAAGPSSPAAAQNPPSVVVANDMSIPPAAIIADMVRRNTEGEGWLSEEQADPEGVMIEWATTVDEFMTEQISIIDRLLRGDIPLAQAKGTIMFLTVSFVVGIVVGYGIARSLGLIGPPRNPHAHIRTRLGNLQEIGSLIGPDGRPLSHGVDPGMGKCPHK